MVQQKASSLCRSYKMWGVCPGNHSISLSSVHIPVKFQRQAWCPPTNRAWHPCASQAAEPSSGGSLPTNALHALHGDPNALPAIQSLTTPVIAPIHHPQTHMHSDCAAAAAAAAAAATAAAEALVSCWDASQEVPRQLPTSCLASRQSCTPAELMHVLASSSIAQAY